MATVKKSYAMEQEADAKLRKMAKDEGRPLKEVLRRAIEMYWKFTRSE